MSPGCLQDGKQIKILHCRHTNDVHFVQTKRPQRANKTEDTEGREHREDREAVSDGHEHYQLVKNACACIGTIYQNISNLPRHLTLTFEPLDRFRRYVDQRHNHE